MVDNIERAIDILEPRDRLEKCILNSLRSSPNGYYNAFISISKNTRFIYIHAYQSYVWNKLVSERIRRFGKKVLIGDLVITKDKSDLLEVASGGEEDLEELKAEEQEEEKQNNTDLI